MSPFLTCGCVFVPLPDYKNVKEYRMSVTILFHAIDLLICTLCPILKGFCILIMCHYYICVIPVGENSVSSKINGNVSATVKNRNNCCLLALPVNCGLFSLYL
uniref:Uncharacterized protein n=1 Tax=Anguilla anguilla TaxID=7936 RepID=A0A0E9WYN5_ANGAN